MALGSALLAAAATTTALWMAGAFDREIVRVTEVVEVREVVHGPAPQETPVQPGVTTAATRPAPIETTSSSILPEPEPPPAGATVETTVPVFAPADLVAVVASRAIPSIVTVQSLDEESRRDGSGSGVVISSDGFIITNHHVVDGADTLRVIMSDGLSYPAERVGSDPLMDIAVLKVEAGGLPYIRFGSMEGLRTGEPAIAVGNPLGLDGGPSVTAGVISAFDRTLVTNPITGDSLYGLLQTDAPITRGSSGGALLDVHGLLLGITTAIGLSDVGAEGLGFAVPINLVEGIVADLMSEGEVRHAFLGVRGSSAFSELEDGVESPLGVEISILEESAIGDAGAEDGDVIVALDGVAVRSMPQMVARLRSYRADDRITVTLQRGDETLDIDLTLARFPS
ncbi:MAG: trypsin-like peptidase domain-containing protein [Acidimicrobiia bacterium]|nr:trypsin-like peptidase domain-containing protein [Acidimicrobiia bacterium]